MKKSELLKIILDSAQKPVYNSYDGEQLDCYLRSVNIMDALLKAGVRPPGKAELDKDYKIVDPEWQKEEDNEKI